LAALLADPKVLKLFHFGRFDIAVLEHALGVRCEPVYCTKIAARLTRTFTDRWGLKDLCKELLGVDLSKQQQTSDWGADTLSEEQLNYAASDVLHLHALKTKLDALLEREGRYRAGPGRLPLPAQPRPAGPAGWPETDIFEH
jgi:Ribonuclease D